MLWYYIILPYTCLINTSYNKSRIVDDGWKTVFVNSVPASFNCILFKRHHRVAQSPQDSKEQLNDSERNTKRGQRVSPLGTSTPSMLSNLPTKHFSSKGKRSFQIKQLDVSVISINEKNLTALNHDFNHAVGELTPVQSTSETHKSFKKKPKSMISDEDSTLNSKTVCNQSSLRKSDRLSKGEQLLSNMALHGSNEDAYMHYFKQLIEFDYLTKNSKTDHLQKFEIIPFNKMHTTKICKIKKSKKIINVNNDTVSRKDTRIKNTSSSKNKTSEEITLKVNYTVDLFNRIQQRQALLDDLETYCYDDELFDSFVNRLVEFEESLIKK